MRILISNDDGYQAKGIKQLAESLSEIADVIIVAPNENKSAASSSLTIGKPLEPVQIDDNIFAIDATPSDCVHFAFGGEEYNQFNRGTEVNRICISYLIGDKL